MVTKTPFFCLHPFCFCNNDSVFFFHPMIIVQYNKKLEAFFGDFPGRHGLVLNNQHVFFLWYLGANNTKSTQIYSVFKPNIFRLVYEPFTKMNLMQNLNKIQMSLLNLNFVDVTRTHLFILLNIMQKIRRKRDLFAL